MTLTFLGTRGYIDVRSRHHRRHSTLAISRGGRPVLIDCGEDWLTALPRLRPAAVVVTHAHPDHAGGLKRGAPCAVWAPPAVWAGLPAAHFAARGVLPPRHSRRIAGLRFEAFPVVHSVRAPAVGYRVTAGGVTVFYVPDVVAIPRAAAALGGADVYIGDGATLTRPILRRRNGRPIGHIAIRDQLAWCARHGVPRAIFTHCGSQLVRSDARRVAARVRALGEAVGVRAEVAHDGLRVRLRGRRH